MNAEFKIMAELEKDFAKYVPNTPEQPILETVSKNGHHLIDMGEHVEVWLLDKYCLMFEDKEMIVAFEHHDKEDHLLAEYVDAFYNNELSSLRPTH